VLGNKRKTESKVSSEAHLITDWNVLAASSTTYATRFIRSSPFGYSCILLSSSISDMWKVGRNWRRSSSKKLNHLSVVRFITSLSCHRIKQCPIFGPGWQVPKRYSSCCCCCCCCYQFSEDPKILKAFCVCIGAQRNFAHTYVLTLPTLSQIFHLFSFISFIVFYHDDDDDDDDYTTWNYRFLFNYKSADDDHMFKVCGLVEGSKTSSIEFRVELRVTRLSSS